MQRRQSFLFLKFFKCYYSRIDTRETGKKKDSSAVYAYPGSLLCSCFQFIIPGGFYA
jgi:hypothetical protein